ncbi:MAG: hypothetical protein ISN29_08435 [Gammaproteobacteria bacterium AqS3]|nr:hypothetical protein [Gammaproteobacteria bacterium AqS3]
MNKICWKKHSEDLTFGCLFITKESKAEYRYDISTIPEKGFCVSMPMPYSVRETQCTRRVIDPQNMPDNENLDESTFLGRYLKDAKEGEVMIIERHFFDGDITFTPDPDNPFRKFISAQKYFFRQTVKCKFSGNDRIFRSIAEAKSWCQRHADQTGGEELTQFEENLIARYRDEQISKNRQERWYKFAMRCQPALVVLLALVALFK